MLNETNFWTVNWVSAVVCFNILDIFAFYQFYPVIQSRCVRCVFGGLEPKLHLKFSVCTNILAYAEHIKAPHIRGEGVIIAECERRAARHATITRQRSGVQTTKRALRPRRVSFGCPQRSVGELVFAHLRAMCVNVHACKSIILY